MKHKKLKFLTLFSLIALLAALAICGCTNQEKTPEEGYAPEDNLYIISRNNQWGVLNADGKFIIAPQENQISILRDAITKAPKYLEMTKIIPGDPEPESEDMYWNNQYLTALYDIEGNMIYDYAEGYYSYAFGDYLYMRKDEKEQLVNMKTQEVVLEDIKDIRVEKDKIISSDYEQKTSRVYDQNFRLLQELDYYFNYTIQDQDKTYFIVSDEENKNGILNADFQLLVPCQYDWIGNINGNYAIAENYQDRDKWAIPENDDTEEEFAYQVVDLTTGEVVHRQNSYISYYDGTIMIARNDDNNDNLYEMVFLHDQKPSLFYENINYYTDNQEGIIAFLCTKENGEKVILDSTGAETMTLPKDSWLYSDGGLLFLESYGEEPQPVKIFRQDGTLIPTEKEYQSARVFYDTNPNTNDTYIEARYETPQKVWMIDVLDGDGNLLVENIQPYYISYFEYDYCDGYRILARKGFYQGLMDMQGNWLYQESIFNTFANEY